MSSPPPVPAAWDPAGRADLLRGCSTDRGKPVPGRIEQVGESDLRQPAFFQASASGNDFFINSMFDFKIFSKIFVYTKNFGDICM